MAIVIKLYLDNYKLHKEIFQRKNALRPDSDGSSWFRQIYILFHASCTWTGRDVHQVHSFSFIREKFGTVLEEQMFSKLSNLNICRKNERFITIVFLFFFIKLLSFETLEVLLKV